MASLRLMVIAGWSLALFGCGTPSTGGNPAPAAPGAGAPEPPDDDPLRPARDAGRDTAPPLPAPDTGTTVDPADAGAPASPDGARDLAAAASDAAGPASVSAGCSAGRPAPAEGAHEILVGGEARKFLLRLPSGYDGQKPLPALFIFHGAGQNMSTFDNNTDLRATTEEQAVLVFPDGPIKPDGRRSWVFRSPDNVLFVDALVAWLKEHTCIDPGRLFATGLSSGGYMSLTLACQRGDVFRAVASASGGMVETGNCRGNPTVWLRIGRADTAGTQQSVTMARDFWLGEKSCRRDGPQPTDNTSCAAYSGCRAGAGVVFCSDPGGHGWPGYFSKTIWNAFSRL